MLEIMIILFWFLILFVFFMLNTYSVLFSSIFLNYPVRSTGRSYGQLAHHLI
jgi:hypothetical protein